MYIARMLYPVRVLGPGERIGIWMNGCEHGCRGCSNPELWEFQSRYQTDMKAVARLVDAVCGNCRVEGFTLTGGDPFFQPDALEQLLPYLYSIHTDILVYTGYCYEEIREKYPHLLKYIAVLIDGRYIEEKNSGAVLKGSDNQRIFFLNEEYRRNYEDYLGGTRSRIQNFTTADGVISVGIHLPGYEKALDDALRAKGLEETENERSG